jgi:abortive infection bacteriophage resistance protein
MKQIFKLSDISEDTTKIAMNISKTLGRDVDALSFTLANDIKQRGGELFKIQEDVFLNKPLTIDFKRSRR